MAAVVAVVLGGGVLIGMGAVVVDVGQLYLEREQLQTGADAGSLAVALNCVNGATCTAAAQTSIAVTYAKKNAADGRANAQVCINGVGCPAWDTAARCPALPIPPAGTSAGSFVEVRTTTVTASGSTLLPPTFAGALAGQPYQGKRVGACARVHWGPPVAGEVFALGFSLCDWRRMTVGGTTFRGPLGSLAGGLGLLPTLGLPAPTAGADSAVPQVLPLTTLGLPMPTCTTPLDVTEPRGYVWLMDPDLSAPDADCTIDVKVGDAPRSFALSGLLVGTACAQKLQAHRGGPPILVPIFDQIKPALLSLVPTYRIVGFAPFVVTGHSGLLSGLLGGTGSLLSGGGLAPTAASALCGTSSCVYGYFTKSLMPQSRPRFGAGGNYGAMVIGRTG